MSGPVSVAELQRAWVAVQRGDFRTMPRPRQPVRRAPQSALWQPADTENVVMVAGCAGSVGATTVSLALATAADRPARVVECSPAAATGLAAAATAELGDDPWGWTRGSRGRVLLQRTSPGVVFPNDVPLPPPAEPESSTIIDLAHPLEQLLAGDGWLSALFAEAPPLVLVTRATVPGLRRLESCLSLFPTTNPAVAVLGPPRRKWPRELAHGLGPATRAALDGHRVIHVPEDPVLARNGLTGVPLPATLVEAGAALLAHTEGNPT